jgi:hypothetical protein
MISARKLSANRANARASTGPRTPAGKARAGRNALRHGLALSALVDPARMPELELLAREIDEYCEDAQLHELAYRIAVAQADLVRVRHVRHDIIATTLNDSADEGPDVVRLGDMARRLVPIDRYERRALSRRKTAIREFVALRNIIDTSFHSQDQER